MTFGVTMIDKLKDFKIRAATIKDAGALARVHVDVWRTTYAGVMPDELLKSLRYEDREQRWKENLAKTTNGYFVAKTVDGIIGFACGGAIRKPLNGFDCELFAIYVLSDQQGRGIGCSVAIELIRWLVENKFKAMMLWVLEENPSRKFYEAIGGKLLPEAKTEEFGGKVLTEVSYGWADLTAAIQELECKLKRG